MKIKNILYFISLILIAISIAILIQFPDSNRMNLIAGILTMLGFSLNIF